MTAQSADRQLHAVPEVTTEKQTIAIAVRDAMLQEMDRDERVLVLGEDDFDYEMPFDDYLGTI